MSAEQLPQNESGAPRFSWPRRQVETVATTSVVTNIGGTAVDPRLAAEPLDALAAFESGMLRFGATLSAPDGTPLAGETVLFTIAHGARTTVKCAAVTDADGVAFTESRVPAGLFDRGPIDFRVGFAGAPPRYWPVSVAGKIV